MNENLRRLIVWIATNNEAEPLSGLMPYGPVWHVETRSLLDAISEIFSIDKSEIGEIVEVTNLRREAEESL